MVPVVLHRFPISNFSEKARVLLEWKRIPYEVREHRAGLPQLDLVRLSGQRKVPVIEHDGHVVSDSTAIAHYLDRAYPRAPRLLPSDPSARSRVLALEDEIDDVLGVGPPVIWFDDVVRDGRLGEIDLLALEVHGLTVGGARALAATVRRARTIGIGEHFVRRQRARVHALLARLASRLSESPYLVGTEPTLADLAAVGLTLHLDWPGSRRLPPGIPFGRGVASFADDPTLRRFFAWRRDFYARHLDGPGARPTDDGGRPS